MFYGVFPFILVSEFFLIFFWCDLFFFFFDCFHDFFDVFAFFNDFFMFFFGEGDFSVFVFF